MLNGNISSIYLYNMVNFGPLTSEICWRVLASLLHRRRPTKVNQTLRDVCPFPALVYYICIFGGSCPLTEFGSCKVHFASNSCVLLNWQRYCSARHSNTGVSQNLRRDTRNGITELLQRAPPICGRAAITFGIGPHSSLLHFA